MSVELKEITPEENEFDGYLVPINTARDLRKSVGQMQAVLVQMARLLQDTRSQMEELQAQQRKVTATHDEVKGIQQLIRMRADEYCEKYGLTDAKDTAKIRAAIKKAILVRYGIKDLHDVPAIARQAVEALISKWADIKLVYRIREKHRAGGD